MENKFLIGNEIIETAIAAFTADPCEDTALAVVRTLQQRMNQDGHLLIPVLLSEGGQSYQLRPLEYDGGAVYMVAFTSEAELEKGGPTNILSHFIDIYFDVVLDFAAPDRKECYRAIVADVRSHYPEYEILATLDTDFSD